MLDPEGHVVSWNAGAEHIVGYRADEIIGQPVTVFYPPEAVASGDPQELLARAQADGRAEDEGWRLRKDGRRFWAGVVITALRDDDGDLRGFAKVTRDLTDWRNARDLLTDLSGRLLQLQDEERRRIARELHDTTSPLLTRLVGRLYAARRLARDADPELGARLDEALGLAESTATTVRTVGAMLHPPHLDQAGVLAALRWYVAATERRPGIRLSADLPTAMPRLAYEHEVALFRATQECLAGIVSAGAHDVALALSVRRRVKLTIIADGVHPVSPDDGPAPLAVAMAAIRSRLNQLGGNLTVANDGLKSRIEATLPLRTAADERRDRSVVR